MKVRELIKELEKLDPELDVTDGTQAAYYVDVMPGYYDGCFTRLYRDDKKLPYYNVTGCKIIGKENKVVLRFMGWDDVIGNDTNVKVEFDEFSQKYVEDVEKYRAEMLEFEKQLAKQCFEKVKEKVASGYEIRRMTSEKFGNTWYVKGEETIKLTHGEEKAVLNKS
jgi:hypothetical protein